MSMLNKGFFLNILLYFAAFQLPAQIINPAVDSLPEEDPETLTLSLEFRPRTEFRNGYRKLRTAETRPAFFTGHRSRLNLSYQRKGFAFFTSIQDIRVWGEDDPRSTEGSLQLFEAFVEPVITPEFSLRIGRQRVMYDNQRLFAQNDWRQNARAHNGLRLIYQKPKLQTELFGAFNQEKGAHERFFETDYSPEFDNYKVLLVHFAKYKAGENVVLTSINAMDGFQDQVNTRENHFRFTSGGRAEYTRQNFYLTLAAYYQYGKTPAGGALKAWYYQPELSYKLANDWLFRLGAEVFSGDDGTSPDAVSNSFDALYGVNHRFLGFMDYFTRFPSDFNNAGLIAPYFMVSFELNKKLLLKSDYHLFCSQNKLMAEGQVQKPYLGFENDLVMRYTANPYTVLDIGFSYSLLTEAMEQVKQGGDNDLFQTWAFVMVTYNPELFRWIKK